MSEQAETIVLALKILLDALTDVTNNAPNPQNIAQQALDLYEQTTRNL